jgi:hypothetical protein
MALVLWPKFLCKEVFGAMLTYILIFILERRLTADNSEFVIDPLQLSPGTQFMKDLKDHLCYLAADIVDNAKNV